VLSPDEEEPPLADWLTVKVFPAIVIVPVLELLLELLPTLYDTVPLPLPFNPLVTEIHEVFDEAPHEQPPAHVTLTVAEPPEALCDRELGEME
jgi:hypothetical protein